MTGGGVSCQSSDMVTRYKYSQLRPLFIKEWLDHLGVNQARLAELMKTSEKNISVWISDPTRISIDVISSIADALSHYSPEFKDAGNLFRHPKSVRSMEQAREAAHRLIETLPPIEGAPEVHRTAAVPRKSASRRH
jgi:Helix-turn-helix